MILVVHEWVRSLEVLDCEKVQDETYRGLVDYENAQINMWIRKRGI